MKTHSSYLNCGALGFGAGGSLGFSGTGALGFGADSSFGFSGTGALGFGADSSFGFSGTGSLGFSGTIFRNFFRYIRVYHLLRMVVLTV